ncbi:MAG: VTT domain-containing protein [Candidatus Methylacidiphilales bacterium]
MKRFAWIALSWAALIILSRIVPFLEPDSSDSHSHLSFYAFPQTTETPVFLEQSEPTKTILLIPGWLGPRAEEEAWAKALAEEGRKVLLPDLFQYPPHGKKTALSDRILSVMDDPNLPEKGPYHIIAFGSGGSAAVALAHWLPDQAASITLINAGGSQEYELLGDYSLNRVLYSLQHFAFRVASFLIPHFGLMDRLPFSGEALRALADTDQRPFESRLAQVSVPVIILHGKDNMLVPAPAAVRHHTLCANSRLLWLEGGHSISSEVRPAVIRQISSHLALIESGGFQPDAKIPVLEDETFSQARIWFITGLVFVGTKFSEDLATVAAGLLVSRDVIPFWLALVTCYFGIMAGDTAVYLIGRLAGPGILRRRPFCWLIHESQVLECEEWFKNRGLIVIVLSRFVPATRLPVYMACGILGVPPLKFIGVLGAAALVWTPLIVGLSALVGAPFLDWVERYEQFSLYIVLAFFVGALLAVKFILPLVTRRGRRMLYRRWYRLTHSKSAASGTIPPISPSV